jgi:parallel beta-helix repeat protein
LFLSNKDLGDGVRIVINANPTVKGNKIYENNRVGVHVYRDGCGTCTENHIYGNKNAGMQVHSDIK